VSDTRVSVSHTLFGVSNTRFSVSNTGVGVSNTLFSRAVLASAREGEGVFTFRGLSIHAEAPARGGQT
jgi:hypothetical protein